MSGIAYTPSIPWLSAMSPLDQNVPCKWDFTKVLGSDTIASVVSVTALPAGLTIGTPQIVAGIGGAALAVQVSVGQGVAGQNYTVTAVILTVGGVTEARSVLIPIRYR